MYLQTAQRAWTLAGNCTVALESGTKKTELWQREDGNKSALHAQQKESTQTYAQEVVYAIISTGERTEHTL